VVIDLDEGKKINAILQDIQFHPVSDKILHVDFYQVFDDKPVTMEIPVIFEGSAPGVLISGGVLSINKRKLKIRAVPSSLPDFITADISKLELGNKLLIEELKSDNYTILHPDNTVICKVRTSRAAIEVEEVSEETTEDSEEGQVEETKSGTNVE
jgi:large subunit ribosomal protein L25